MRIRFVAVCFAASFALALCVNQCSVAQSFEEKFGDAIDLDNLDNYANQPIPAYITKDNTAGNPITDAGATLGRVLFYDKELSVNRTTSCSSCHKQELAFSDDLVQSLGENGVTGRHSVRLINARFSQEPRMFWDERAASVEDQATQPIRDHVEMGFSGQNGNPDFSALITRMAALEYYEDLFTLAFGDPLITEVRMQIAIAQFVRSIQSFDSKFDVGRAQSPSNLPPFPNFTTQENEGKTLFRSPPQFTGTVRTGGGAGCAGCHQMPEFDMAPRRQNNGVIANANGVGTDLTNTRSPSLRDIFNSAGGLNSQMMHNGAFTTMDQVLTHYDSPPLNAQLDNRLKAPNGTQRQLNLTAAERASLTAFMQTLTGSNVYSDLKWSDPFPSSPKVVSVVRDQGSIVRPDLFNTLDVTFDQDVQVAVGDLRLQNDTTSQLQDLTGVAFDYDATTFTATWNLNMLPVPLSPAFFTLELVASNITAVDDAEPLAGNGFGASGASYSESLYVAIPGDANLDGLVDVLGDAVSLVSNLGTSSGVWAQGDFNGDGNVTVLGDAIILVNRLGQDVQPVGN